MRFVKTLRRAAILAVIVPVLLLSSAPANAGVAKNEPIISAVGRTFPVTQTSVPHTTIAAGDGKGYWLAASDGGVFAFGSAKYAGSASNITSHAIVGIAKTKTGAGYWLVASDGGIFAFGDAKFYGSLPGLNPAPKGDVVASGMAAAADGNGYYIFTRAGGVYTFGSAQFFGSAAGKATYDLTGFGITSPLGKGYFMADTRGVVYAFGDAGAVSQAPLTNNPSEANRTARVSMAPWSENSLHTMALNGAINTDSTSSGYGFFYGSSTSDYPMTVLASCGCSGYYQAAADGSVFAHGDAMFYGSLPQYVSAANLVAPIIGMASNSQYAY